MEEKNKNLLIALVAVAALVLVAKYSLVIPFASLIEVNGWDDVSLNKISETDEDITYKITFSGTPLAKSQVPRDPRYSVLHTTFNIPAGDQTRPSGVALDNYFKSEDVQLNGIQAAYEIHTGYEQSAGVEIENEVAECQWTEPYFVSAGRVPGGLSCKVSADLYPINLTSGERYTEAVGSFWGLSGGAIEVTFLKEGIECSENQQFICGDGFECSNNRCIESQDDSLEVGENVTACAQDVKECSNGGFVSRNPNNNCQFYTCPLYGDDEETANSGECVFKIGDTCIAWWMVGAIAVIGTFMYMLGGKRR